MADRERVCVVAMGEQFLQVKSSTFCSQEKYIRESTDSLGRCNEVGLLGGVGGGRETKSVYTAFCFIFSSHKSMEDV